MTTPMLVDGAFASLHHRDADGRCLTTAVRLAQMFGISGRGGQPRAQIAGYEEQDSSVKITSAT